MVAGGLKGDKPSDTSVAAVGKNYLEDFRGWGGAGGGGMGNGGFPTKREGGVLGDNYCQGGLEGLRNGGELSS